LHANTYVFFLLNLNTKITAFLFDQNHRNTTFSIYPFNLYLAAADIESPMTGVIDSVEVTSQCKTP